MKKELFTLSLPKPNCLINHWLLTFFFLIPFSFDSGTWDLEFGTCTAQDIHFSQHSMTPLQINPGLTGVFNGDQRVILNYKDQWRSVNNSTATYKTSALSFDMGLFKQKWENSYLGLGIFVFSDKAGDAQMGISQGNISLSSIIAVAEGQQVSVGMQGGFAQRSVNTQNSNLRWEQQYVNGVFDPTLAGEATFYEPFSFADFSAGASWNYGSEETSLFKNNMFKANAGLAYHHINTPKQKFHASEKLYSKIVAHAGFYIGVVSSRVALLPSITFFNQGPTREINVGGLARLTIKEESKYTGIFKESAVLIGGHVRVGDAIIPSVILDFSSFSMGVSYDVNVSKLKVATNARGGMEFSMRFINPNPYKYKYGKKRSKSVRFL